MFGKLKFRITFTVGVILGNYILHLTNRANG